MIKKTTLSTLALIIVAFALIYLYLNSTSSKNNTPNPKQQNNTTLLVDFNQNYDTHPSRDKYGINQRASVDYYTLVLSWSPGFCRRIKNKNNNRISKKYQFQCVSHQQNKWVIHGLWPQNKKARNVRQHPRFCQGNLPPVNRKIMQPYLNKAPGFALLQAQWEKHGSCAFRLAKDYFQKQEELYDQLYLPSENIKARQTKQAIQANNPSLKKIRFHVKKNEIQICYNLNWKYIHCPN